MSKRKIEPVPGYDWRNYDKKKGIDPTGIDVVSNQVVDQVCDLILGGYSDSTIRDLLYATYGVNSYSARYITGKAHTKVYSDTEKACDNLLQKQNARLYRLYRMAIEQKDTKSALQILSEISKLNKLYVQKIEVSSDVFTLDLGLGGTNDDENREKEN